MRISLAARFFFALSLMLSVAGCGEDKESRPSEISLRVATLNLRNKEDWWEDRFPLIADGMAELKPDFVGLQEVSQPMMQLDVLLDLIEDRDGSLDYTPAFIPAPEPFLTLTGEGIAILSRFDVVKEQTLYLSDGRLCYFARVEVGEGQQVDFYNTHLHALASDDDIRAQQTADIVEFMAKNDVGFPTVLTGDFNSTDGKEAYGKVIDAGFVDVFREVHGDDTETIGNTFGVKLAREPVEQNVDSRIDYIFARPGTDGSTLEYKDAQVAWDQPAADGLYPSDHFGVVADLVLVLP